jgi:hypothetical protein
MPQGQITFSFAGQDGSGGQSLTELGLLGIGQGKGQAFDSVVYTG